MTSMLNILIKYKTKIVFGMLFFVLGHFPCFAQTNGDSPNQQASGADQQIPPAIAKELEAMRKRIDELEAELKHAKTPERPTIPATSAKMSIPVAPVAAAPAAPATAAPESATSATAAAETAPGPIAPFSDADWTWLNGNPRTKEIYWDSKFFTPEIRSDTVYVFDFNRPTDHSMGGSSELFRSQEVQLTQLGVGGDFHYDNVRARLMTQFGMYSTTTPRNDPSPARGQWDLADAYRYISEAYGGYHFGDPHRGVNVQAGLFMSYIGLWSYYNFDNWTYQPSYVSSNTPWFFNGMRVQWFPTDRLKIEPWLINGWQSYGRFNGLPGIGGQGRYAPTRSLIFIFNQYFLGADILGDPGRHRIHTDDSVQVKWYENPHTFISRVATTF